MLLLVRFLTELLQRVCLCCHVQLWCFALACEVREHLSTLEFLLQTLLVVPLQLLYLLCYLIFMSRDYHRLRLLFLNRLLLLLISLARISQVVEPFRLIGQLLLRIPLQFHLPLNDLVKIITVRIVFRTLHYVRFKSTLLFLFLLLLQLLLMVPDLFLYQFYLC